MRRTILLAAACLACVAVPAMAEPTSRTGAIAHVDYADRWCDQATVEIGRWSYWPYGSEDMSCKTILRRARAFVLHNRKPKRWKCRRYTGSEGQPYGSCYRGDRYFGVTIPH